MAVSCSDIRDWMIICEILGGCGSQGGSTSNLVVDGGVLWVYDEVRDKWLSSYRLTATAGRKGRAKNSYLHLIDNHPSNLTGYRMTRDGTITAIAAQTRAVETWTLQIRKNGDPTNIASLSLSGVAGAHDHTVNIDVDEGDQIQFYADTTAFLGIRHPFAWIEVAWRNDTIT